MARHQLAFAADLALERALEVYGSVSAYVGVAKVGLSLFVEHGPKAVEAFQALGAKVFLDLKLHDIPNTVELASARAGALGVSYLTIHAAGGAEMIRAAVRGAGEGAARAGHPTPIILAVTVLTSMNDEELRTIGVGVDAAAQVERLALLAKASGATGLVCSAREVSEVRRAVGGGMTLCTPGIRPAGADANDQSRVETPGAAIAAGSDLLVIGRPISAAADPVAAARAIDTELSSR